MRRDCNEKTALSTNNSPTVITASEAQIVSLIWTITLNKTPEQCASKTTEVTDEDSNET